MGDILPFPGPDRHEGCAWVCPRCGEVFAQSEELGAPICRRDGAALRPATRRDLVRLSPQHILFPAAARPEED